VTSFICTICMRSGSKGIPGKNQKLLNGKPLLSYTIEQAIESEIFEHVVVSTDSEEIFNLSKKYGADAWFLRPKDLATDESAKLPVVRHALLESEKHYEKKFDYLVDLDATSPLREISDIQNACNQFIDEDADNLITASPSRKNPYFNMVEKVDGRIKKVKELNPPPVRRQDAPSVYDMNASIYIWKRDVLLESDTLFMKKTSLYVMPEDRSVDIDSEIDWKFVEFISGRD